MNPNENPIVPKLECLPTCDSGINSSTTTYIIAPVANESKYGSIRTTSEVNKIVIPPNIGSAIPDRVPYKNDLLFEFPLFKTN